MNIRIGSYSTKNFDFAPLATEAFMVSIGMLHTDEETEYLSLAAQHVDEALGIERAAVAAGTISQDNFDQFNALLIDAESIFEELGLGKIHGYLRDIHEVDLVDLLELDDEELSALDDGLEFEDEEDELEDVEDHELPDMTHPSFELEDLED